MRSGEGRVPNQQVLQLNQHRPNHAGSQLHCVLECNTNHTHVGSTACSVLSCHRHIGIVVLHAHP